MTNKSNRLTFSVASLFVRTSPLAVITVVGLLDVLMVSNSAESRSFSLTTCILAPESTTNSPSSDSLAEALGRTHFAGEKNVALSFALSLYIFLARSQALLWAHRSYLSVCLFVGPILEFCSVGTSLMSRCALYFSERWTFLVPDTRVT